MRVARVRILLWCCGAALLAAAALALTAATRWPLSEPTVPASATDAGRDGRLAARPAELPPLTEFEDVGAIALRRPLRDRAAEPRPAAAPTAQAQPPLAVWLLGTITGGGGPPRGVFQIGLGKIELKSVGDAAGNAQILQIDEGRATLSHDGRTVVLTVRKPDRNAIESGLEPPPSARMDSRAEEREEAGS